jgi:hypothetical protein
MMADFLGDLVNDRHAELHRVARRHPAGRRRARRSTGRREGTPRQRLGWTLVEVGLRLAVDPDEEQGRRDHSAGEDFPE